MLGGGPGSLRVRIDDAKMQERKCDDADAVGAPRCGGARAVRSQAAGCFFSHSGVDLNLATVHSGVGSELGYS